VPHARPPYAPQLQPLGFWSKLPATNSWKTHRVTSTFRGDCSYPRVCTPCSLALALPVALALAATPSAQGAHRDCRGLKSYSFLACCCGLLLLWVQGRVAGGILHTSGLGALVTYSMQVTVPHGPHRCEVGLCEGWLTCMREGGEL
jgi:hypothetical protein